RQRLLDDPGPLLFFVLDESILLRLAGNKEIADEQVIHLIDAANNSNVTIEIIPLNRGIYRNFLEPFTILEFSDVADSDVLYLESARDAVISQYEAGQISSYNDTFEQLRAISLGPEGSIEYLQRLVESPFGV